ncbi:hypothetical protein [Borreliella valaisiana]|uniref:hypothetical protein n=1 Tax=Borreliella valaisiana TaxID=62088 RepID=UPI003B210FA9
MHKYIKLLILIILLSFSCTLNKSQPNNQLGISDEEKIEEYQKSEFPFEIHFSNEILALKDKSERNVSSNSSDIIKSSFVKTILKIEKQSNDTVILSEVPKENNIATKKLLEIKKDINICCLH